MHGAEIILVSTDEGMEGARDRALEIAQEQDAIFLINLQILQIEVLLSYYWARNME